MSYDPTQPTPIDVIRGMARDTSGDAATEILKDAEYAAILARYGASDAPGAPTNTALFYRAAAESLRQVAIAIEQQPTSVAAQGDGSVGWGVNRTASLRAQAAALDAQADAIDATTGGHWGTVVTVRSNYLTGGEVETW